MLLCLGRFCGVKVVVLSLSLFGFSCSETKSQQQATLADQQSAQAGDVVSSEEVRYVAIVQDGESAADVAAEMAADGTGSIRSVYRYAVNGFAIDLPNANVGILAADPRIAFVAKDLPVVTSMQTIPPGIDRVQAAPSTVQRQYDFTAPVEADIAIIDTGIDLDHPDLNVFDSVSFVDGNTDGDDDRGHGTHVAGIAAARNNDFGVVGVAPGARLWNVKVLNGLGRGFLCDVIAAIDYATEHAGEIEVINMSLSITEQRDVDDNCGQDSEDPLHLAICGAAEAGIVVVAAGGNANRDAGRTLPAAYGEVLAVSAVIDTDGIGGQAGPDSSRGADDTFAPFSNFGAVIDLAAPGVDVLSTWNDGGTSVLSGTSMAAPHVAGAAALFISLNGKPVDAGEVVAVRKALVEAGAPQDGVDGFTGDSDGFAEPLLDLDQINPEVLVPNPDEEPDTPDTHDPNQGEDPDQGDTPNQGEKNPDQDDDADNGSPDPVNNPTQSPVQKRLGKG